MENMTFIFLGIIIVYLVISFIKTRMVKDDKEICIKKEEFIYKAGKEESCEKERAAIASVIAAIMGDSSYIVKRVYAKATVDERISSWRTAGRTEIMTRKNF